MVERYKNMKRMLALIVLLTVFLLPAVSGAERFGCRIIRTQYRLISDPVNQGMDIPLAMDIYLPEPFDAGKEYPGVLFLYGCAWLHSPLSASNINNWDSHGVALAERGYISFAIDYRTTPLFFYPAPIEDAQYALDLITGQESPEFIEQFCRPVKDVAIVGFSSGGNIAALMGTARTGNNREHVCCIASGQRRFCPRNQELPLTSTILLSMIRQPMPKLRQCAMWTRLSVLFSYRWETVTAGFPYLK
jgi:hypothetical protein